MSKIYTLTDGKVQAAKSLNFEQFLSAASAPDKLNPTNYGLAYAYSASVWADNRREYLQRQPPGVK